MKLRSIFFLSLLATAAHAQFQSATLQFGELLPQSNLINPAIAPDYKVVVGLPFLSSIYTDVNTPLSFQELWKDDGSNFVLNEEEIRDNLRKRLKVGAIADIQLFYFGLRSHSSYFSVSLRNRLESKIFFPSDFVKWVVLGPADINTQNSIDLSEIEIFSIGYNELSVSYSKALSTNLRIGGRAKYLSGMVGLNGSQDGFISISTDSASINISNLSYQSSNKSAAESGNWKDLIGGNSGFGLDIGFDANVNSDIQISGSITDIGFINWKKNIEKYESQDASYTFSGYDLVDLLAGDTPDYQTEIDSIAQRLEPQTIQGGEFRTGLNPKLNLSANYKLAKFSTIGMTIHSAFDKGNIDPIISVNHILNIGTTFHLLTGITYREGKFDNISGGMILKPGPVQFYFISDRMNSFFYPSRARSVNLRFGMNITIGKPSILSN